MLTAIPASAQQSPVTAANGQVVYGAPEQITVMFSDADALAGVLRRQGVADAEAAAIENGVRKSLSVRQRKDGAILQIHFTGHYGARSLDRVSVEPVSGSALTLTRAALGLPTAPAPIVAAAQPVESAPTKQVEAPAQKTEAPAPKTELAAAPVAQPAPQAQPTPQAEEPAPVAPVKAAAPEAAAVPASRPGSSGGAAPAVMAQYVSMIGRHAISPGFARASGIAAGDVVQAMRQAGIPRPVAEEVQAATKLHPTLKNANLGNSRFEIVYDPSYDGNAGFALAAFNVDGRDHRVWRFQPQGAPAGLFTDEGERLSGVVLRSPMPGIEINSGFGMRKHPVFRVAKMHWGVDFPAQHGTPIYAAADGVITAAKRYGNYGLYMHIDHGQGVATTYGHMSSFAPGMKPGVKVKAGDVIAHVGRTGVATGPHLYFEVVIGERRVDPEPLIAEGGSRLIGSDLLAFERVKLQSGVTEIASESRN